MKKRMSVAQLAVLRKQTTPRPSACKVCGKKLMITGTTALHLCLHHKAEYQDAKSRLREKEKRENAAKDRELLSGVQVADHVAQPVAAPVTVRQPPPPARPQESNQSNAPLARQGHQRSTLAGAVALISAPIARREGYRHGWLGNTGMGKTTANQHFLGEGRLPQFTLIHDDAKLDPQYKGATVEKIDDAPDDAAWITLRGDPFKGTRVEVETVAALALQIARASREPVRLVVDELDRACTLGGKELASQSLRDALTQGRALGVSVIWSTQTPQRAPKEVIDQSSTIGLFQLGPRALNYLDERLFFDADLLQVVPTLGVGEFVIYEAGRPWNRTIYTSPA